MLPLLRRGRIVTAPRDLTTIVEKVARDLYAQGSAEMSDDWDDLDNFAKYLMRDRIVAVVTATLRAIDEADA